MPANIKTAKKTEPKKVDENVTESNDVSKETVVKRKAAKRPLRNKITTRHQPVSDLDLNMMVCVNSLKSNKLIYIDPKTHQKYIWNNVGDENWLTLSELVTMRNSHPIFFKKNWIIIEDNEIMHFLRVTDYYMKDFKLEDMDTLFDLKTEEDINNFKEKLINMPESLQRTVSTKAMEEYESKELFDIRIIKIIEDITGYGIMDNSQSEQYFESNVNKAGNYGNCFFNYQRKISK